MTTCSPLVVESLEDVQPVTGRWVYLRGEFKLYTAVDGKWVPYETPPTPDLWSHLTADDDDP